MMANIFFIYFLKRSLTTVFASQMGWLGFFLPPMPQPRIRTHVSSVAPLWVTLITHRSTAEVAWWPRWWQCNKTGNPMPLITRVYSLPAANIIAQNWPSTKQQFFLFCAIGAKTANMEFNIFRSTGENLLKQKNCFLIEWRVSALKSLTGYILLLITRAQDPRYAGL